MTEKRRRTIIVIGVIVVVLALLALLYFLFGRRSVTPVETVPTTPSLPGQVLESAPARPVVSNPIVEALNPAPSTQVRTGATQVAELFAERYGSWSTQEEPYRNLLDLFPVMSDRYRTEVGKLVAKAVVNPAATYEGITSAKINSNLVTDAGGAATVTVLLQQTKTNTQGTTDSYRTLKVNLVKVGVDWKVDGAAWTD